MADESSDKILTRRQAVAALGVGVVAVGGAAAVTAVEATSWAKRDGDQQAQELRFQVDELQQKLSELNQLHDQKLSELNKQHVKTQQQLAGAQAQIELYRGLSGLYDTLDNIGIDTVVGAALGAYKTTLDALSASVNLVREGIVSTESALDSFEATFASIRNALTAAEGAWANVNALFKNAQETVAQATSPLLPLIDQASRFIDDLLGKIPFGAGEGARRALNGMTGLMVGVPAALETFNDGLFRTMREGWFSNDNAQTLEATLAQPIVNNLLQPARRFLDQVQYTLNSWEIQVAQPVNSALSQRQIVMQQITEYKDKNGLA